MSEDYSYEMATLANKFIDSLSASYSSSTLAGIGLLLILVLCGLLLWLRDGYRPSQLRKIAEKYGLTFSGIDKESSSIIKDAIIPDYRENIIKGRIKDKEILIYDRTKFDLRGLKIHGSLAMISRITVVCIDGSEEQRGGIPFVGGVLSINQIDSVLADLEKA